MADNDFLASERAAKKQLVKSGASAGPVFGGNASFWQGQVFGSGIEPSGKVECENALAVGKHSGALYVALNAMPDNEEPITFSEGATITFYFSVAEDEDGEFKEIGPTVCLTAPAAGMTAEPGCTLCKCALPDFPLPYTKLALEFSGEASPGKLEAGLGYAAR